MWMKKLKLVPDRSNETEAGSWGWEAIEAEDVTRSQAPSSQSAVAGNLGQLSRFQSWLDRETVTCTSLRRVSHL